MLSFTGKPDFLDDYAVAGFQVDHRLGEIGTLVIYLQAKLNSAMPEFVDHAKLQGALGEPITCEYAAWKFTGVVEGIEFDGATGDFRLVVRDGLASLGRTYASRVFTDTSFEDILSATLPSQASFQCLGNFGRRRVPLAIQYQESHLDFLKRLVAQNGGQLWCYGGEIFAGSGPSSESVELRLGRDFVSYSFGTHLGLEKVEVSSIAYRDKNKRSPTAVELAASRFGKIQDSAVDARNRSNGSAKLHIVHEDASYKDVEGLGESVLRSQASGRFSLSGVLKAPVALGAQLTISNFDKAGGGDPVSEKTIVRAIRGISMPREEDARWHVEVANPEALLEEADLCANHLQTSTGIVTDASDPESMNRVKVRFPWDENDTPTPWLRVATPSWGADHVHYLPPRPGDTVVVLWGQWDMDPVVVGAVAAGDEVASPSDKFVFQTVEGHKVTIDDKTIRIINEASSGGTEVEIAPDSVVVKTKDGQLIEITRTDITIKSGKDVTIKASGSVAIKAGANLELANGAGASISLSGPTVSINNGALDVT